MCGFSRGGSKPLHKSKSPHEQCAEAWAKLLYVQFVFIYVLFRVLLSRDLNGNIVCGVNEWIPFMISIDLRVV